MRTDGLKKAKFMPLNSVILHSLPLSCKDIVLYGNITLDSMDFSCSMACASLRLTLGAGSSPFAY